MRRAYSPYPPTPKAAQVQYKTGIGLKRQTVGFGSPISPSLPKQRPENYQTRKLGPEAGAWSVFGGLVNRQLPGSRSSRSQVGGEV